MFITNIYLLIHELSDNCNILFSEMTETSGKKLRNAQMSRILCSAWNTKIFPETLPSNFSHKARSEKRKLIVRRKSFVTRLINGEGVGGGGVVGGPG